MRRGQIWRYVSKGLGRECAVLVVSTDAINSAPAGSWFLAVELVADDPGHLLAVEVPGYGWATPRELDARYTRSAVEHLDSLDADTMDRVAAMLRIALDL